MKNIQKEIADIQKTIKAFSKLLDQIEKTLTGKTKRKKEKKIAKTQEETPANPPLIETETVEVAE